MRLAVWAPRARRVELAVEGDGALPMAAEGGGWHAIASPLLVPGLRYGFRLDGGPPLPDPRSRLQPEGVDGPSQLIDADFPWQDAGWTAPPLGQAILYELHVGTFTAEGTFDAAIARLDHLVDLGVTALELMPVAEFAGGRGWGYDGVDLFAVRAGYGGPDGLRRLVDACHRRGLAVVIDVVYNHLGPAGNHLAEFGPYFTDDHRTPWGRAVNLDGAGSDEVRGFVVANAVMWLSDYHADGLRLDAVHALHDESATHIVEELAEEVDRLEERLGRRLWLILETERNDPRAVRPRSLGGWGADAHWADDFHHAVHTALTGEAHGYYVDYRGISDLATALRSPYVYRGQHSPWLRHRRGRDPGDLSGDHFVVCVQNHDQVGNRARGERLGQLVDGARLRAAALLLLTSPYVPLLFAGEEWGASTPFLYFTDHAPDLGRLVTEGRRREFAGFGWDPESIPDPQAEATFAASRLRWQERDEGDHRALLDWYRRLTRLRRETADLGCGNPAATRVRRDPEARWLAAERGRHIIALNLGVADAVLPAGAGRLHRLLATGDARELAGALRLGPAAAGIWRVEGGP